jgi:long-chain acyl-CoA synthetase
LRTFTTPRVTGPTPAGSLSDDLVRRAHEHPDAPCLARRDTAGWHDVSAADVRADVAALARGLLAAGIETGDRVLLCARTRYEWTLLDYACWEVGAVVVPVYATSPAEHLQHVLADSGAVAAVVETDALRDILERLGRDASSMRSVWVLDSGGTEALTRLGAAVPPDRLEVRRTAVSADHLATLLYTSGTTGVPRGCALTHGNFSADLDALTACLPELFEATDASTLLTLPLAHVLARLIQVGCVRSGVRLGHAASVTDLAAELSAFRPTFVLGVPRVLESIVNAASQRAYARGRGPGFVRAAETAIAYSRAEHAGRAGRLLHARHAAYERVVYRALRAELGGRTQWLVSGGAPLGERLAHFFTGVGLPVLEGYGLTESAGALCVNTPTATKIGTVGRPVPGTSVRVGDDGELLFRGPQVFGGYWRGPTGSGGTVDPSSDGWLHTGDLGEIDAEGFVRVTGRRREILVTAGGKQVAPGVLEEQLRSSPLVGQAMVVGDGRPYLAALVTLDPVAVRAWATSRGASTAPSALATDTDLLAEVQQAVDAANESVSQAEAIRHFRVLPTQWSEQSGHLTPTAKLKRQVVLHDFSDDVEALYT